MSIEIIKDLKVARSLSLRAEASMCSIDSISATDNGTALLLKIWLYGLSLTFFAAVLSPKRALRCTGSRLVQTRPRD